MIQCRKISLSASSGSLMIGLTWRIIHALRVLKRINTKALILAGSAQLTIAITMRTLWQRQLRLGREAVSGDQVDVVTQ